MREYGVDSLSELQADNIYLKGGSNMAEALQRRAAYDDNGTGGGQPMSIAMRMKRNREALQMAVKV